MNIYGDRWLAIKENPNAIIRKLKNTQKYIAFYDHITFQDYIKSGLVRGYMTTRKPKGEVSF